MRQPPFHGERLVFCEGVEDAAFLRYLRDQRQLGEYDIRAVQDIGGVAGISGFKTALVTAVEISGFKNIRHLVLVADSDDQPGNAFSSLCRQIQSANKHINVGGRFAIPNRALRTTGGHPRITILLNPTPSAKGALETLYWRALTAVQEYAQTVTCVDAACSCAGIVKGRKKWGASKIDKARIQIAFALINKKNPAIGLGRLWIQAPSLISINDPAFDDIANRLSAIR